jgi:C4-dicarboxylate transporter DctM subunit
MALTGVIYFVLTGISLETMIQKALSGPNSFELCAIPLFILAGELMSAGGISNRLITISKCLFRHVTGGMALYEC